MPSRTGEQHDEHVRLAIAEAPAPIRWRVGADVAEPLRAVGAGGDAFDEFGSEKLDGLLVDAERPQAGRGERDLRRLVDLRLRSRSATLVHFSPPSQRRAAAASDTRRSR